jgi:ATP-dependent DNA ligase
MTGTIPLAKGRNDEKRNYPGYLSVKLDGVPIRIDMLIKDSKVVQYGVQSRQGKPVPSVEPQVQAFLECMNEVGLEWEDGPMTLVAEVTHETLTDFKDVSGVVRKQEPQQGLILNFFDVHHHTHPFAGFGVRLQVFNRLMQHMQHEAFRMITQWLCTDAAHAAVVEQYLLDRHPGCEGLIWRDDTDHFTPGKRQWSYQKLLNEPTMDLRIVGFEEAKCGKNGAGKGMVGRLIADYKGKKIGVGPGKLTHKERVELWVEYQREASHCCCGSQIDHYPDGHSPASAADYYGFPNRLAQIKYKKDDSYDALRQPTFQCWRDDKTEPSYE